MMTNTQSLLHSDSKSGTRRSFTLTELMVAVAVLIVVIIATSKIFGTASQVTSAGTATIAMLTEAAAIEQQIRDDISKLTHEGFFAIRCRAVRNNVREIVQGPGAPLLNPNLPSNAIIRADQLVFFANGVESSLNLRVGEYVSRKGQGVSSRIYYGHGFQLPAAYEVEVEQPVTNPDDILAHDPNPLANNWVSPWYSGNVAMARTKFGFGDATDLDVYESAGSPAIDATQPEARKWLLVRQPVLLVDDDVNAVNMNSKTVYLGEISTARSIFVNPGAAHPSYAVWGQSREVRNGRVDAAASELHEIRTWVTFPTLAPIATTVPRAWAGSLGQRFVISSAVYYPRAERRAPSMHRIDQALTNHVIAGACSSFTVEWTYDRSVGDQRDPANAHPGMRDLDATLQQPWFGLRDDARGVRPMNAAAFGAGPTLPGNISPILPSNMESYDNAPDGAVPGADPVEVYEALFGYNQTRALNGAGVADPLLGYTPFPTALRITMRLHDPEGRLENGREFQFVVDLPQRE